MRVVRRMVVLGSIALGCAEDRERAPAPAAMPVVEAAPQPEPVVVAAPSAALVAAHAVIEATCGECHRSDLETAVPAALAVFDLWDPQWLARLDDAAFASMMTRLEDQGVAPEDQASVRAAIAEVEGARLDPDCTRS
jgi:cytochrome c5